MVARGAGQLQQNGRLTILIMPDHKTAMAGVAPQWKPTLGLETKPRNRLLARAAFYLQWIKGSTNGKAKCGIACCKRRALQGVTLQG
jgi:hypothetical protein